MSDDDALLLMRAESAAAAGLFGPIPGVLAGASVRVVDAHVESPQREFVVFESPAASVFVYESLAHDGDVGLFLVELFVEDVSSSELTPTRVRNSRA